MENMDFTQKNINVADEMIDKYLTFELNGQIFAVPISEVLQILKMQPIVKLPMAPEYIEGVLNLQEQDDIIIIADLRTALGYEKIKHTEKTCIVITYLQGYKVGFIVDSIKEVITLLPNNIFDPPKIAASKQENSYLLGIGKTDTDVILLLDMKSLIDIDGLSTLIEKK